MVRSFRAGCTRAAACQGRHPLKGVYSAIAAFPIEKSRRPFQRPAQHDRAASARAARTAGRSARPGRVSAPHAGHADPGGTNPGANLPQCVIKWPVSRRTAFGDRDGQRHHLQHVAADRTGRESSVPGVQAHRQAALDAQRQVGVAVDAGTNTDAGRCSGANGSEKAKTAGRWWARRP